MVTDGTLVDLGGYGELEWVDRAASQVRVQAGIPLRRLNDLLAERGLALPNLGDIDYQSIAGATQTATHGTGLRFRNISSAIIGMRLVDGRGEVIELRPRSDRADVFTVRPRRCRRARPGVHRDVAVRARLQPPRRRGSRARR